MALTVEFARPSTLMVEQFIVHPSRVAEVSHFAMVRVAGWEFTELGFNIMKNTYALGAAALLAVLHSNCP